MPRPTRAASVRQMNSRSASERAEAQASRKDPLHVPQKYKKAGYRYGWIRRAAMNQEDRLNISTRARSGWRPVPLSEMPELAMPDGWEGVVDTTRGYIEQAGLVLCSIPVALFDEHAREDEENARDSVRMPHIEGAEGAPLLPMDRKLINESFTSFEQVKAERKDGRPMGADFKE